MNGEILFSSISLTLRRQISLSSVKNGVRNQRVRELDFSVKWSCLFLSVSVCLLRYYMNRLKALILKKGIHMVQIQRLFRLNVVFADEIAKGCNWPRQAFAKEKNILTRNWEATLYPNPANQMLSKSKWEVFSLLFHVKRSIADYLIIAVLI